MHVATMHRVGPGSEGFALAAPVGSVAGVLAVNDIRRDCQNRLSMKSMPVGGILSQLRHERRHKPRSELIDAIVVVTKLRKLSFGFIIGDQAGLIANDFDLRVTNCRKTVSHDGQTGYAKRHGSQWCIVVKRHLDTLVGIL